MDPKPFKRSWSLTMLPRAELVPGVYYFGHCRNARIARWDGARFFYWRQKMGREFPESIPHPDDEPLFDVFVPMVEIPAHQARIIPLDNQLFPVAESE